jgi:hypothetical protein
VWEEKTEVESSVSDVTHAIDRKVMALLMVRQKENSEE